MFTGPGGGPGVPRGTRTVLFRHNLRRTYHDALAKLADPATPLRPTARRSLLLLRDRGPQRVDQLAARLTAAGRWAALPVAHDALLDAVELHGAHDLRHTYATWLEDAGIPLG